MDLFEAIKQRRAIKHYDPNLVIPDEDLGQLMDAVSLAPSSFNLQHWRLVRVDDKDKREQLREAAWGQAQVTEASILFLICADTQVWNKDSQKCWRNAPQGIQDRMVPKIKPFYEGRDWLQRDEAMRSVGIVAQTLMLSAKALGYDSCPMIGFDQDKAAEIVNLPQDHAIGMMLAIGKGTKAAWPKPGNRPVDEILVVDQF